MKLIQFQIVETDVDRIYYGLAENGVLYKTDFCHSDDSQSV